MGHQQYVPGALLGAYVSVGPAHCCSIDSVTQGNLSRVDRPHLVSGYVSCVLLKEALALGVEMVAVTP